MPAGESPCSPSTIRSRRSRRRAKLAQRWLARYVSMRLMLGWSPQQIAARLKRDYPRDMRKRISRETIYASIYIIPRGQLRRMSVACFRQLKRGLLNYNPPTLHLELETKPTQCGMLL